ncbi:protein ALTERED PHOSPHATE STARVATION RESPONSE 1-like [Rutidosis leptorrhynchoides]|uniref:protein ALTERED PHOSPHATE STARVATION RESPONSE 1-like n=1 Tax=Rutidosis leptorrhynchoides TaxID=125765 RepID=UPI003A99FCE8
MGCSESKINDVQIMNQCKERKAFMKQSVAACNTFAACLFAYAEALKNTGSAFADYAKCATQFSEDVSLESPHHPKLRPCEKDGVWDFFYSFMDYDLAQVDDKNSTVKKTGEDMDNVNLLQVFTKLDDGFLKASKSVHKIWKILDGNKLNYHSNHAHNQGDHISHSARIMRVITWNESFKGRQIAIDAMDDFASRGKETHVTLLEKILAWEMKLCDQVKVGEMKKREYQKKVASLDKLRKRGASNDLLERTQDVVTHMQTRYIVDLQSIESTVSEINCLRDEQLYPKLVRLIEKMSFMWKNMRQQHQHQFEIVQELKSFKFSHKETSERNLINTQRLYLHVRIWGSEFEKLITRQKEYIKSLNNWLKLDLISIDSNSIDKKLLAKQTQNPKIQPLLSNWLENLEKLTEQGAINTIIKFALAVETNVDYQLKAMKLKEKCEETRMEITKRSRKFEEWCDKQITKGKSSDEVDIDVMNDMEVVAEQEVVVAALKRRLVEEEEDAYRRWSGQVMDMRTGLPEVFMSMMEFACVCSNMYVALVINVCKNKKLKHIIDYRRPDNNIYFLGDHFIHLLQLPKENGTVLYFYVIA